MVFIPWFSQPVAKKKEEKKERAFQQALAQG